MTRDVGSSGTPVPPETNFATSPRLAAAQVVMRDNSATILGRMPGLSAENDRVAIMKEFCGAIPSEVVRTRTPGRV